MHSAIISIPTQRGQLPNTEPVTIVTPWKRGTSIHPNHIEAARRSVDVAHPLTERACFAACQIGMRLTAETFTAVCPEGQRNCALTIAAHLIEQLEMAPELPSEQPVFVKRQ